MCPERQSTSKLSLNKPIIGKWLFFESIFNVSGNNKQYLGLGAGPEVIFGDFKKKSFFSVGVI